MLMELSAFNWVGTALEALIVPIVSLLDKAWRAREFLGFSLLRKGLALWSLLRRLWFCFRCSWSRLVVVCDDSS